MNFRYTWLHHIFGWMKCHHWLSVSYKLISAIDGDAITNYGMISLLNSPADSQCLCPDSYSLAISRWYEAENHVQAYAPWGALSLNQWDSLTSKLDGYPTGWDSPLSGAKPVHEENCQGIKLRKAHKIKRLNSRLQVKRKSRTRHIVSNSHSGELRCMAQSTDRALLLPRRYHQGFLK